jgi:hypothetical protein
VAFDRKGRIAVVVGYDREFVVLEIGKDETNLNFDKIIFKRN